MPFFVSPEKLDEAATLRAQNERLEAELASFEEMRPLLQLAEEVRSEIVSYLNTRPDLNAPEIAEQAYRNVLDRHIGEARDEVTARYEQEHRRTLYDRVLGEVAMKEGDSISEHVRQRVETDPELASSLRESARKELAARATNVVRAEINAEQQAVIDEEAERQIELDHLDVKMAVDRELDLDSEAVKKVIRPGDKVELFFKKADSHAKSRITLTWTKDANGKEGWVFVSGSETLVMENSVVEWKPDASRFVTIGSVNKDLETGQEVIQENRLAIGLPLVCVQKSTKGTPKVTKLNYRGDYHYGNYDINPVVLVGTDFQTEDIVFTGITGKN